MAVDMTKSTAESQLYQVKMSNSKGKDSSNFKEITLCFSWKLGALN